MAESKKDTGAPEVGAEVTQTAQDAPGGIEGAQAKPAADMSASELREVMTHEPDKKLYPKDLHPADKTSVPGPEYPPIHRPPVSSVLPDEPVLRSLVTGAGAHQPPDPDKFEPDGRPKARPTAK